MDNHIIKEALDELFSSLEALDTQSTAILQFLKEKKHVTGQQLAPYLEQAGKASNVKWRAARVRIDHLFAAAEREEDRAAEKQRSEKAQASSRTLVNYMQQSGEKLSGSRDAERPTRSSSTAQQSEKDSGKKSEAEVSHTSTADGVKQPQQSSPGKHPSSPRPPEQSKKDAA